MPPNGARLPTLYIYYNDDLHVAVTPTIPEYSGSINIVLSMVIVCSFENPRRDRSDMWIIVRPTMINRPHESLNGVKKIIMFYRLQRCCRKIIKEKPVTQTTQYYLPKRRTQTDNIVVRNITHSRVWFLFPRNKCIRL